MTAEKQQSIVKDLVSTYFDKYGIETLPVHLMVTEREHIIYIGTSVLCTKWEVGYLGGDFVKAIVDNNLQGAFSRADHINTHCIKFYLMLLCNVGMPYSLIEICQKKDSI